MKREVTLNTVFCLKKPFCSEHLVFFNIVNISCIFWLSFCLSFCTTHLWSPGYRLYLNKHCFLHSPWSASGSLLRRNITLWPPIESADPAQLQLRLGQQDTILESQQQQLLLSCSACRPWPARWRVILLWSKLRIPAQILGPLLLPQTWVQRHHHRRPVRVSMSPAYHHRRGTMDPPGTAGASWPNASSSSAYNPAPFPQTPPEWSTSSPS